MAANHADLLPVSATGDLTFLDFNGKPQLLISGRGSATSAWTFCHDGHHGDNDIR